jgi:hypothetical protein
MMRLEPYARKKPFKGWNSHMVERLILEMHKSKEPLSIRSLHLSREPAPDRRLSRIAKRSISKKQLHSMACYYYGTWGSALESCGLRSWGAAHNRFWGHTLIVDCIRHLRKSGHPLTVKSIHWDRSKSTTRLLVEVTGRWTTGAGLYNAACRLFLTWDRALTKAGIEVDDIKEKPFWTKRKMVRAIQALHRAHVPLNAGFVQNDRSRETTEIIRACIGKPRDGRSLIGAAYRTFGSWDRALKESGLKPSEFRVRRFKWDKQSIAKILRALQRSKVPLNGGDIGKDVSDQARGIILKVSGRKLQGRSLYNLGRRRLGSWDKALKYSGFTPGSIRKIATQCEERKDRIIEIIQALHIHEHELNVTSMLRNSKKVQKFLEPRFDRAISGYSVTAMAKKLFGSWDKALWEAGLNPNEIRRRSPAHTTNLPVVLYQVEDTKVDGERRRVKYLGAPPKSPDQVLEDRDTAKTLKAAVEDLDDDDQELTERIFDAILQIHHYRDQKQLIQYITRWLGGEVSEEKVATIFARLSKNMKKRLH